MKNIFQTSTTVFVLLTLLTFEACVDEQDDLISQNCNNSCTTINGTITTNDGTQPLTGVKIVAKWINTVYLGGGTIRKKATTSTDNLGNYTLRFNVREDELKAGYFELEIQTSKEYFKCGEIDEYPTLSFSDLKNDTTINRNLFIPYVAYLNVDATGVQNMLTSETFMVTVEPTVRTNSNACGTVLSWYNQNPNYKFEKINLPANQKLVVETVINKGQSYTRTYDTLYLKRGQTSNYTATYK